MLPALSGPSPSAPHFLPSAPFLGPNQPPRALSLEVTTQGHGLCLWLSLADRGPGRSWTENSVGGQERTGGETARTHCQVFSCVLDLGTNWASTAQALLLDLMHTCDPLGG